MKLAVMQPYFFPYLGYFQLIAAVDKFVLYDDLAYIKKGWVNRNKILIKNQQPAYISLPVQNKSSYKKIKNISLKSNENWKRKILNLIYFNYKKAKFFEDIYPTVKQIINSEHYLLSSLNAYCIDLIAKKLKITTEISTYPEYNDLERKLDDKNFMTNFSDLQLENPERKVVRILKIAEYEKADIVVNPIGGKEIYSKKEFHRNDVSFFFLKMNKMKYPQFSNNFYTHLSIVDVLMHNGWEGTARLLDEYTMV